MNNYAILPASVRYDKGLSNGAKLLYAELTAASQTDGSVQQDTTILCEVLQCDRRTLYRYFKDLYDRGHIKRIDRGQWRLPLGFESLSPENEAPELDEDTKAFYKEFFTRFQKGLNCWLEKEELYYPVLSERLNRFSKDQVMRALENRIAFIQGSEWHQMPENRQSTVDVSLLIRDDQSLLKWLNMRSERSDVELKPIKWS